MDIENLVFQTKLLNWGKQNIRKYPWRFSQDIYSILVSEFMLHRTDSQQVIPIYNAFVTLYPDPSYLIKTDTKKIHKLIKPLGLNWRLDAFISNLFELKNDNFFESPSYDKLIKCHGVGEYIAGATFCFYKNEYYPLIDTNIIRIISRYSGITINDKNRKNKSTKKIINMYTDRHNPRMFYYSIIDFAHKICKAKNPLCNSCIFHDCSFRLQLPI